MSEIEVKALEWRDYPGSRLTGESKERYGFHEFGAYIITRGDGVYSLGTFTNMGKMRPMGGFKLLDEAKAAAQSDFDARIRSALVERKAEPVAWYTIDKHGCDYISRDETNLRTIAEEVGGEVTPLFSTPSAEPVREDAVKQALTAMTDVLDYNKAFPNLPGETVESLRRAIAALSASPSPVGEGRDGLETAIYRLCVIEDSPNLQDGEKELIREWIAEARAARAASPVGESRDALLPDDIIERLLAVGRVEWGTSLYQTDEKHVEDLRDTLRITREYFSTEAEETAIHGVYLEGTGTVLAHTGNSPNSPQHARILVGAWNQLVDIALAAKEQQP